MNLILPPTILDVEASGFGRGSYPIEIGCILSNGAGFCELIRPEPDWTHWDPQAEAMHHISRDLLLDKGFPVAEAALRLNNLLAGLTVYSDAWGNDYTWLWVLFDAANMQPSFTLESLRKILNDQEAALWHQAKAVVERDIQPLRHRASTDARVLQLTWLRVKAMLNVQHSRAAEDQTWNIRHERADFGGFAEQ